MKTKIEDVITKSHQKKMKGFLESGRSNKVMKKILNNNIKYKSRRTEFKERYISQNASAKIKFNKPMGGLQNNMETLTNTYYTKMKFSIKDLFSKCHQVLSFLPIWSHLLKKSLIENFT